MGHMSRVRTARHEHDTGSRTGSFFYAPTLLAWMTCNCCRFSIARDVAVAHRLRGKTFPDAVVYDRPPAVATRFARHMTVNRMER
jgi:hypothetical protein